MLWTLFAVACAPMRVSAQAAPAVVEPSTPYAIIDWPNPLNPNFAALGDGVYLLNTRSGPKVWQARENQFDTARQWPTSRNVSTAWSPFYKGRLLVASGTRSANFDMLVWWDATARMFSEPIALPEDTVVQALLPVGERNVLACVRTGYGVGQRKTFDELPTRAFVLEQADGKLRQVGSSTPELRTALLSAGVRGVVSPGLQNKVEGSGNIRLDVDTHQNAMPLIFNTANCKWEMSNPPDALKNTKNLNVKHHILPNGDILIAHADWFDEEQQTSANLRSPYLWDRATQRWQAQTNTAQGARGVDIFSNYGPQDPVVSIGGGHAQYVEFLDPNTLRWTRSGQRLPDGTYFPVPAPLDADRTLVFLRERGQVLLVSPMAGPKLGEFTYAHSYLGEVALAGAGLVLLGGGSQWEPINRPEQFRLATEPELKAMAPLPQAWNNLEGVELRDKTILVFGGLPTRCGPSSMFSMPCRVAPATPSYRYSPANDRWEEVRGLRLNFANGEPLDYGNSDIATQWPRKDTQVRANGDFVFLSGPTRYELEAQSMTPLVSTLMRWNPTSGTTPLGKLRQARIYATVLELNDRRLVVLGGETGKKLESSADQCQDCGNDSISTGAMEPASATEIFVEATGTWRPGPAANFGGGRAVKLANGKIFKFSLAERYSWEGGYRAEIADALFSHWKALPPFPHKQFKVQHVAVAGNRVLFFSEKASDNTLLWDDTRQTWRIWGPWFKTEPLSVVPLDARRALIRSFKTYEIANYPN
jgi:hypothetical protein